MTFCGSPVEAFRELIQTCCILNNFEPSIFASEKGGCDPSDVRDRRTMLSGCDCCILEPPGDCKSESSVVWLLCVAHILQHPLVQRKNKVRNTCAGVPYSPSVETSLSDRFLNALRRHPMAPYSVSVPSLPDPVLFILPKIVFRIEVSPESSSLCSEFFLLVSCESGGMTVGDFADWAHCCLRLVRPTGVKRVILSWDLSRFLSERTSHRKDKRYGQHSWRRI